LKTGLKTAATADAAMLCATFPANASPAFEEHRAELRRVKRLIRSAVSLYN
jgi:hypothetical protein